MKKLNCSFPWYTKSHPNLTTCSEEKIRDLVTLADDANIHDEQLMKEIEAVQTAKPPSGKCLQQIQQKLMISMIMYL